MRSKPEPLCCEDFELRIAEDQTLIVSVAGKSSGPYTFPSTLPQSTGQIEQLLDGTWGVFDGMMGGGSIVLSGMKFCPFCGGKLPGKERPSDESHPLHQVRRRVPQH